MACALAVVATGQVPIPDDGGEVVVVRRADVYGYLDASAPLLVLLIVTLTTTPFEPCVLEPFAGRRRCGRGRSPREYVGVEACSVGAAAKAERSAALLLYRDACANDEPPSRTRPTIAMIATTSAQGEDDDDLATFVTFAKMGG